MKHTHGRTIVIKDSGWTQMTGTGSKGALAVYTTTYSAVNFAALDIGNIGLNALSTQVASLTTQVTSQSARIRSLETALFNTGILGT